VAATVHLILAAVLDCTRGQKVGSPPFTRGAERQQTSGALRRENAQPYQVPAENCPSFAIVVTTDDGTRALSPRQGTSLPTFPPVKFLFGNHMLTEVGVW